MNQNVFDCIVCLEMCQECINCTQCNQILCRKHVARLPDDRCPACRASPFRFQENIALRRIISDVRRSMGVPTPPSSPRNQSAEIAAQSPAATEDAAEVIQRWFRRTGTGRPTMVPAEDERASDIPPDAANAAALIQGHFRRAGARNSAEAQAVLPRYGRKIPCRGRDGQFAKIPSQEHEHHMRCHVRSCREPGCRSVWSGPWGKFIGGADGQTHFDLSECTEGKRLNVLIGWNYENPAR